MNIAVRTAEAADGGTIILGAFCPECEQEAMPMRDGTCGFCGTPICDPEDGPPHPDPPKKRRKSGPREKLVSTDDIVAALQHEAARLGRPPYGNEWLTLNRRPSQATIYRRFGTWGKALEAAGLAREEAA